jgi:DNA-binding NarL/FixJ family response regulator
MIDAPSPLPKIRLLLADDHPVVRMGMRSYFSNQDRVEIVGEAGDGHEVLTKTRELRPDVVFMDTYMPRLTGLAAAKLLGRHAPRTKVLMYSVHGGREYVLQIIRSGARGFVLKNAAPEELMAAVEKVNQGETYYNSDVARLALDEYARNTIQNPPPHPLSELSEREVEVLAKIAEGKSSRETAADFGISVRTVETHREHIMRKLHIHSVAGLVKFAISNGIAPIE